MASSGFWSEMEGVLTYVNESCPFSFGRLLCWSLELTDSIVRADDCVVLKVRILEAAHCIDTEGGTILQSASGILPPQGQAVLRISHHDYETVPRHATELRVIQAPIMYKDQVYLIDALASPACVAGSVLIRSGEALQMAELFSGGFMGWSRAGFVLRSCGLRCHTSWCLDADAACAKPFSFLERDLYVATAPSHIRPVTQSEDCVFIPAGLDDPWWHGVFLKRPVQLTALSPPCQPWSSAGTQSGLKVPDGMLVVSAARILGRFRVPVVLLEEVAGFAAHPDYPEVMRTWAQEGYVCVWKKSLQLSEVAPTARKRFFLIFRHKSSTAQPLQQLLDAIWHTKPYPTFADMKAHFPHIPEMLLAPCRISDSVLQVYLSPEYCPADLKGCVRRDPVKYRVRSPAAAAECFMAQYHRQHCLPETLIQRKGILSSLIKDEEGMVRFYAAPEIASAHGVCGLHYIPSDDVLAMRFAGHALAVPQAALVLAVAMQCFYPHVQMVEPHEVVHEALRLRLHADNTALLPLEDGWLMCHTDALASCLQDPCLQAIVDGSFQQRQRLHLLVVHARVPGGHGPVGALHVAPGITLQSVVDKVAGKLAPALPIQSDWQAGRAQIELPLPLDTELWHDDLQVRPIQKGLVRVLTHDHAFMVAAGRADTYLQLASVFWHSLGMRSAPTVCLDVFGGRIRALEDLPPVVLLLHRDDEVALHALQFSEEAALACTCVADQPDLVLVIASAFSVDWWLTFPRSTLDCLGYDCTFDNFPTPDGEHMIVTVHPRPLAFQLASSELVAWFRTELFLSVLRHVADTGAQTGVTLVKVEVQVVACTVWQGCLPASSQLQWM